jgi:hypothetical protein
MVGRSLFAGREKAFARDRGSRNRKDIEGDAGESRVFLCMLLKYN